MQLAFGRRLAPSVAVIAAQELSGTEAPALTGLSESVGPGSTGQATGGLAELFAALLSSVMFNDDAARAEGAVDDHISLFDGKPAEDDAEAELPAELESRATSEPEPAAIAQAENKNGPDQVEQTLAVNLGRKSVETMTSSPEPPQSSQAPRGAASIEHQGPSRGQPAPLAQAFPSVSDSGRAPLEARRAEGPRGAAGESGIADSRDAGQHERTSFHTTGEEGFTMWPEGPSPDSETTNATDVSLNRYRGNSQIQRDNRATPDSGKRQSSEWAVQPSLTLDEETSHREAQASSPSRLAQPSPIPSVGRSAVRQALTDALVDNPSRQTLIPGRAQAVLQMSPAPLPEAAYAAGSLQAPTLEGVVEPEVIHQISTAFPQREMASPGAAARRSPRTDLQARGKPVQAAHFTSHAGDRRNESRQPVGRISDDPAALGGGQRETDQFSGLTNNPTPRPTRGKANLFRGEAPAPNNASAPTPRGEKAGRPTPRSSLQPPGEVDRADSQLDRFRLGQPQSSQPQSSQPQSSQSRSTQSLPAQSHSAQSPPAQSQVAQSAQAPAHATGAGISLAPASAPSPAGSATPPEAPADTRAAAFRRVEAQLDFRSAEANRLQIVVHDDILGRVSVRLVERAGLVDAMLRADQPHTARQLSDSLGNLADALAKGRTAADSDLPKLELSRSDPSRSDLGRHDPGRDDARGDDPSGRGGERRREHRREGRQGSRRRASRPAFSLEQIPQGAH